MRTARNMAMEHTWLVYTDCISHYFVPKLTMPHFCSAQLITLIYYAKPLPLWIEIWMVFSIVHSIYAFFVSSVNKWNIIMSALKIPLQTPNGHQDQLQSRRFFSYAKKRKFIQKDSRDRGTRWFKPSIMVFVEIVHCEFLFALDFCVLHFALLFYGLLSS